MQVRITVLGAPELSAGEQGVDLGERTSLFDLKNRLAGKYGGPFGVNGVLLAFVNGKAAQGDWNDVTLSDGDIVMFVVPISGG